jgi:hypothetical protein
MKHAREPVTDSYKILISESLEAKDHVEYLRVDVGMLLKRIV